MSVPRRLRLPRRSDLAAGLRRHPDAWLLSGATLALLVALLRPTAAVHEKLVHALFVIDITQSMNVVDGHWGAETVSRGELARLAVSDLLRSAPCGSRVGLGVFNEYRTFVLLAPIEVCANFRELQATLDSIGNRMSWAGASEIAKGINSGFQSVKALPDKPAFVMFTDGHEAPPISLAHRPKIDAKPGDYSGVLVGTGALRPQPIPKVDPQGVPIGVWKADEVDQIDPYSQGRQSSVPGEAYADDPNDPNAGKAKPKPAGLEHLSALHEAYLQQLSAETGLGYLRLDGPGELLPALHANGGSVSTPVRGDLRWVLALAALGVLVAAHLGWSLPASARTTLAGWRARVRRAARPRPAA